MSKHIRICLLAAGLLLASGALFAQSSPQAPASAVSPASPAEVNSAQRQHPAMYPAPGEKPVENADEEENAQFKYSPIVLGIAKHTGLSKQAVYWIFLVINFAIFAAGLVWVVRKVMPHGFAPRSAEIKKEIEEARRASAEASARLREIEDRLARLGDEIAGVRASAETGFSVEEQRIKADAEQDAKRIRDSAEQEIAAASRTAQRDLKVFVAGLAVDLAEKKIRVDDATDQALISGFAAQLGKDGQ